MANQAKAVKSTKKHLTKMEIFARETAEAAVVTNPTTPIPNAIVKGKKALRTIFDSFVGLNDHFTEADSVALNTLTVNYSLKMENERKLLTLDIMDEEYDKLLNRLDKLDKKINESMKQLCMPLNARLSLANDMAKVMIEEKKLASMNAPQTVNPLMALLGDDDDDDE